MRWSQGTWLSDGVQLNACRVNAGLNFYGVGVS